jgi:hypothetical protein
MLPEVLANSGVVVQILLKAWMVGEILRVID